MVAGRASSAALPRSPTNTRKEPMPWRTMARRERTSVGTWEGWGQCHPAPRGDTGDTGGDGVAWDTKDNGDAGDNGAVGAQGWRG